MVQNQVLLILWFRIVSGHYPTRTTTLMRAIWHRRTVGGDNTGIELNSQMVGMNLILYSSVPRLGLPSGSLKINQNHVKVCQYHPLLDLVLSHTSKHFGHGSGAVLACDVPLSAELRPVVSTLYKLISIERL